MSNPRPIFGVFSIRLLERMEDPHAHSLVLDAADGIAPPMAITPANLDSLAVHAESRMWARVEAGEEPTVKDIEAAYSAITAMVNGGVNEAEGALLAEDGEANPPAPSPS